MSVVQDRVRSLLESDKKSFRNEKLHGANFDGVDLRKLDFRNASIVHGSFRGCDLSYTNFESANLYGADFTDAKCYRTNFVEANLSTANMYAKDLFGARLSLECKLFQGLRLKPGWWYGWIFYALLMQAPDREAEEKLIAALGTERYEVLRQNYANRSL